MIKAVWNGLINYHNLLQTFAACSSWDRNWIDGHFLPGSTRNCSKNDLLK